MSKIKILDRFCYGTCCDCGRVANYRIRVDIFTFTVCQNCLSNYTEEEE